MSYTCTKDIVLNPTHTVTAMITRAAPCPEVKDVEEIASPGFFGSIWAIITSFFGTFASVVGGFFRVVFGTLLPVALGFAVACLLLLVIIYYCGELFSLFARKTGLAEGYRNAKRDYKEREEREREEKGDLDEGAEIIDVADGKKRVEVEIEFLENLLKEKREELESLE